MPKLNNDLFLVPKGTWMIRHGNHGGISRVSIVASKDVLYLIPIDIQAGAGTTLETTTFKMGGLPTHQALEAKMGGDTKTILKEITEFMTNTGLEEDIFTMKIASLKDFNVKAGWFFGNIMFRSPKDGWRDAISIGKTNARELREFLGL